jgi:hypothetical protein
MATDRENVSASNVGSSPAQCWLVGALAWAVPGLGHLWLGRTGRALLLAAIVFSTFLLGLWLGGHLHGPANAAELGLLAYVYTFCNLGTGLLYLACQWAGVGLTDQAYRATAEYGNIFLIISGLLNYLSMLDAYDIAAGRKP